MKIDNANNPFAIKKNDPARPGAIGKGSLSISSAETASEAKPAAGDTVNISDRSRLIAKATELSQLAPDIRSEKVADITARIAAGTYNVSSRDVADSIIKKSISGIV
ncbi:MAG: flagellar biosynthesis anti-sigma factor FlgM [Deltaproteobacteria bacterium]|jgi:negative regulator of flagellin synthesis FlgM|nr:flagellar biosynthesis anti-sigma factor FlgM [Deltaproteobacteria bacterium]